MAARYGASSFSRGARSAFYSFRNSSSASQTARPPRRIRNLFENGSPGINRRRLAQTMVPLHAAVSSALLVTRLSISSRSSHSISRGSYKETLTHTVGLIKSRASGPFLLFLSDAAGVGSSSDLAGLKPIP
ncbi:uncharacterized protein LOC131061620 isoform X2 [Cryptomeria japonica]|uniref:uncharacterized protein LOC131061620 isoform X2 n=1 Tax=Cryptomeria japonica TaxID=3369 RepID=UPI0027DA3A9F|nr:uncharacterized protein LOC131061620 isoform X2 [Cryptomeria japonica]XP_057851379.2 uncharacterized protein LOC131061620 isoform X2 [Cryptomeria japonica]